MNALAASFIVALIGVTAFVIVAALTTRGRIGLLPPIVVRDSANSSHVPIDLPESAKKFRVLGWMLVLFFYLTAIFCRLERCSDPFPLGSVGKLFWQPTFGPKRNCPVFKILDSDRYRVSLYGFLGANSFEASLYVNQLQVIA
jgi:hypothetical protein